MLSLLHPQKTGGTFVEEMVIKYNLPVLLNQCHEDYLVAKDKPENAGVTQFLATIRHPVSWYRSFWRFRMEGGWGGNLVIGHGEFIDHNFESWVDKVTSLYPGYLTEYYSRYLVDGVSIFHQENLSQEVASYFEEPRILVEPKVNTTSLPCSHTGKTIEMIMQSEATVINTYYGGSYEPQRLCHSLQ